MEFRVALPTCARRRSAFDYLQARPNFRDLRFSTTTRREEGRLRRSNRRYRQTPVLSQNRETSNFGNYEKREKMSRKCNIQFRILLWQTTRMHYLMLLRNSEPISVGFRILNESALHTGITQCCRRGDPIIFLCL